MIGTRNGRSYLTHMGPNYTTATVLGCYRIRRSSKWGSGARQPRSAQAYTSQVPSPCDSLSHCDTLGAAPRSAEAAPRSAQAASRSALSERFRV